MNPFGFSRTKVHRDHAFIAPDSHVEAAMPGWTKTQSITLISPQMGARFTQYLAKMEAKGTAGPPLQGVERFIYVLAGSLTFQAGDIKNARLRPGHYVYLPPDLGHKLQASEPSRLVVFERRYVALAGVPRPDPVMGRQQDVKGEPFLGDPAARLKTLLPVDLAFDMAVNLFTFQPGAALPFVEVHVMEHGLLFVEGQGIYRLANEWYPIQAGDVLWMAPYCPQWFAAIGKTPSAYLYYKDVNRDPLGLI